MNSTPVCHTAVQDLVCVGKCDAVVKNFLLNMKILFVVFIGLYGRSHCADPVTQEEETTLTPWADTTTNIPVTSHISFKLYTRGNLRNNQHLEVGNDVLLSSSNFNKSNPTAFLSHGFGGSYQSNSVLKIKDAYLYVDDYNVVITDWKTLARMPQYTNAAGNVVKVGKRLAEFMEYLESQGANSSAFEAIGFSLGAHVVGFAGKFLKSFKLPKIVGLDPAGPLFYNKPESERLHSTDAVFVQVIHSSGDLVGVLKKTGHADFYPNGGKSPQPGCEKTQFPRVCSHNRAVWYFEESVYHPEAFASTRCSSWKKFLNDSCPNEDPVVMGYGTPVSARGKYYFRTSDKKPYYAFNGTTTEASEESTDKKIPEVDYPLTTNTPRETTMQHWEYITTGAPDNNESYTGYFPEATTAPHFLTTEQLPLPLDCYTAKYPTPFYGKDTYIRYKNMYVQRILKGFPIKDFSSLLQVTLT